MFIPIAEIGQVGWAWDQVKFARQKCLEHTDLWYLKDRWDALSTTRKGQLNSFRQTLRDLPQTYSDPEEAVENFPEMEDWF